MYWYAEFWLNLPTKKCNLKGRLREILSSNFRLSVMQRKTKTVGKLIQYLCYSSIYVHSYMHVFFLLPNVISGACWADGVGSPCHYHAAEALRYKAWVVPQYWWLTRRGAARETGTSGEVKTGRGAGTAVGGYPTHGRRMEGSGSVCKKRRNFGHMSAGQVGCSVSHTIYAYYCIFITLSF